MKNTGDLHGRLEEKQGEEGKVDLLGLALPMLV